MENGTIAIVIPALNPDERLPGYVAELRRGCDCPIVLVNDGSDAAHSAFFAESSAGTPDVAVLTHDVNKGKGRALKTAFGYLLGRYGDLAGCVTADADGQHLARDVFACIGALRENKEALVMGCRQFDMSHVPWRSRFGNKSIRLMFALATGLRFQDTQTGLRAIPASFMRQLLDCKGERFDFESRMLLAIGSRPLVQVPIETVYLEGNKSSHFSPLRDSARIFSIVSGGIFARLSRFIAASLCSFALDIALFWLFKERLFDGLAAGRLALSVALARVASATFNYLANLYFVFDGARARRSFLKYASLACAIMAASYLLLAAAVRFSAFARGHETLVKAAIDLVLFIASFAVQRLCIFSKRQGRG